MTTHSVLIHQGTEDFCTPVASFVGEGLAAGERVLVIAAPEKLDRLHAEFGDSGSDLELQPSDRVYSPPARAIRFVMNFLDRQPERRTRLVAEQDLGRLAELQVAAYLRQEAAANAIYRDRPLALLCAYDETIVSAAILDSCRQTHDGFLDQGRLVANPGYVDPATFLRASMGVVPPSAAADVLACEHLLDLPKARYLVELQCRAAGLGRQPCEDLVLAVNEVVTNALTHGRPPARLSVYREGPALVCHVDDPGPGIADPLVGYLPPPTEPLGGRGLWLARQLCDSVEVTHDGAGCHVRLLMLPQV